MRVVLVERVGRKMEAAATRPVVARREYLFFHLRHRGSALGLLEAQRNLDVAQKLACAILVCVVHVPPGSFPARMCLGGNHTRMDRRSLPTKPSLNERAFGKAGLPGFVTIVRDG